MHLAAFVEELLRARGMLMNIPTWLSVYTKVRALVSASDVLLLCQQGAALNRQELISDLVEERHDSEDA